MTLAQVEPDPASCMKANDGKGFRRSSDMNTWTGSYDRLEAVHTRAWVLNPAGRP